MGSDSGGGVACGSSLFFSESHEKGELAIAREAVKIIRSSLRATSRQLGLDPTAAGIAEAGVDRNFVCGGAGWLDSGANEQSRRKGSHS